MLAAGLLPACTTTPTPPSGPIRLAIAGASSMTPLLTDLAEAYETQQPDVTIDVQRGGSALGRRLVETGQIDIGLTARPVADLPDDLNLTPIAHDAVAIVVNDQTELKGLSLREVRDIFSGRLVNWRDVAGPERPIQVVSRETGSGTRAVFEAAVMDDLAVTPTAIVLPNSRAMVDFVADNPGAVGYVSFTFLREGVDAVPVEGVAPTPDSLADSSYFLTRELALLTRPTPQAEVRSFLDFIKSPAGQAIIAEQGLSLR